MVDVRHQGARSARGSPGGEPLVVRCPCMVREPDRRWTKIATPILATARRPHHNSVADAVGSYRESYLDLKILVAKAVDTAIHLPRLLALFLGLTEAEDVR